MKLRKLVAVLLVTCLFLSLGIGVSAEDIVLQNSDYYTTEHVEAIANFYMEDLVNSEHSDIYQIDGSFLELYAVNGVLVAYLVPLSNSTHYGYMVIGAVSGGPELYLNTVDHDVQFELFAEPLAQNQKIIFEPPFNFWKQTAAAGENEYALFDTQSADFIPVNDSGAVEEAMGALYPQIFAAQQESRAQFNMQRNGISPRVTEIFQVSAYPNFMPITGTSLQGGNQAWFPTTWQQNTGCGPVAIANIMAYYARYKATSSNGYSKLYKGTAGVYTESSFTAHMNEVIYVTGTPLLLADEFVQRGVSFAYRQGINFSPRVLSIAASTTTSRAAFVIDGLNADKPVALQIATTSAPELQYVNAHWMTIYRLLRYSGGDVTAKISTWGDVKDINLNALGDYSTGALVYF